MRTKAKHSGRFIACIAAFLLALCCFGSAGAVFAAGSEEETATNCFPSEGFENMLEEGEESFALSEVQRNSVGSLSVDSHATVKKEESGNIYLELTQSEAEKPFSSFFAMMTVPSAGDYTVSVDFYKEAGWTDTDNLGFRFYSSSQACADSEPWKDAINEAEEETWVTLTQTYSVSAASQPGVDSFQMWFNTMGTNVLRVDNVKVTYIEPEANAPTITGETMATWKEDEAADITFTVDLMGEALVSVTNDTEETTLTSGDEYTLAQDNTSITFDSDYFASLGQGEYEFTITTAGGSVGVVVTVEESQGQIPDSTEGYTLEDTMLGGDFESYEVGLTFSADQTEEAWGSVSLDDPGVIADDNGNHVLKIAKRSGSSNIFASAFCMTSPDITLGDIVTFSFDYKLDGDTSWYQAIENDDGAAMVCFVGNSNQSYHLIRLDYTNHAQTRGVSSNTWDVTYTEGQDGWVSVKVDFIVDFAFLNATNSVRFLFPIHNDTDALYIDNVRLVRWVDENAETEEPEITPAGANFDGSAPADLSFTVDLKDYRINRITVDGNTVSDSNYTLSGTTLTIDADFLATLTNGEHTFTLTTLGGEVDFTVTVTNSTAASGGGDETPDGGGLGTGAIIGIVAACVVVVAAVVVAVVLVRKKKAAK